MPRLLVSVRHAQEAKDALEGGADLIDVKEPLRGPLGAAERSVIESVIQVAKGRVAISVACGELLRPGVPPKRLPDGVDFAKIGLSGTAIHPDWIPAWQTWRTGLRPATGPVAVAYADAAASQGLEWQNLLPWAVRQRCRAMLIDTFNKGPQTTLDYLSQAALNSFVRQSRRLGITSVIAGSIRLDQLPALVDVDPDFIGIRGSACLGGRGGRISTRLVREFAAGLATARTEKRASVS